MYFDPRGNKFQLGMDQGARRQYDFSTLIKWEECPTTESKNMQYEPYDSRALTYCFPEDCFLVLNESVEEHVLQDESHGYNEIYQIIPLSFNDYTRMMQKHYKYPTKSAVWRMIMDYKLSQIQTSSDEQGGGSDEEDENRDQQQTNYSVVELIGRFNNINNIQYKIRYVRKPNPIILVDLSNQNLEIDGENTVMPCELPEGVHHEIVQRAAELATAIYNPQALGGLVGVGNVSETNLGVVPSNNDRQQ